MSLISNIKYFPFYLIFILHIFKHFILADDPKEQSILDFRSNPLGISEREGIFPVLLSNTTQTSTRIMAYLYYNNDKL